MELKKSKYPVFSNGTEFDCWMARNCDRCVKATRYNKNTDTYTKFRCAVNREIIMAYLDDGRTSQRTYDICQNADCPNIQTERKVYAKRPKTDNQPKLFDV